MKTLDGLRWRPRATTHLGCIEACVAYLGLDVPTHWIYGGTGHAFVNNIHGELCPSGPTAWDTHMLFQLAPNLGYRVSGVCYWKGEDDPAFRAKQRDAWDMVRAAIDVGLPCYGWQMEIPEFYLIPGYDERGYHYAGWGCADGKGPLEWDRLATWDVTLIEVYRVEKTEPASDAKLIKDALQAALTHAARPSGGASGYTAGPAGFKMWADALDMGRAGREGQVYNCEVWGECRGMAADFLRDARNRLPGACDDAFEEAARQYTLVRDRLDSLRGMFSPRSAPDWSEKVRSADGAELMRACAAAEQRALGCLEEIASAL